MFVRRWHWHTGPPALLFIALLLPGAGATDAAAWTWEFTPGIEWAACVGTGETVALLVLTHDGALALIDAQTGRARWDKPLRVPPGTRLAEGRRDDDQATGHGRPGTETLPRPLPEREGGQREHPCVYLFDRTTVYALPISGAATFGWQYSSHGDPGSWAGDPEFLTGWSAAADTPHGVMAVGSDGQVVLLAHDDGHVCWRDALGPLPLVRLHTFANHAVIMWKARGRVRATVCSRLSAGVPRASLELGDTWPLWSTLVGTELILVTPPDVAVWQPSGEVRRFGIGPEPVWRATIAVSMPTRPGATAPTTCPTNGTLLLMGGSAGVRALDLADGRTAWSWQPDESVAISSLRVHGACAIAQADHAVFVLAAATGALVATLDAPTACGFPSTHVVGDALWGVVREPADAADDERLVLRTVPLGIPQTQPASAPARVTGPLPLGPADVREILWPPGHVVVVAPNALRAYKLP